MGMIGLPLACAWCSLGLLHQGLLLPVFSPSFPSSLVSWCCVLQAVQARFAALLKLLLIPSWTLRKRFNLNFLS